jgi:hypothetical protein
MASLFIITDPGEEKHAVLSIVARARSLAQISL